MYHFKKDDGRQERGDIRLLATKEEEEEIVFGNERGGVEKAGLPTKPYLSRVETVLFRWQMWLLRVSIDFL